MHSNRLCEDVLHRLEQTLSSLGKQVVLPLSYLPPT